MPAKHRSRLSASAASARRLLAALLCVALVVVQASYACESGAAMQIEICSEQGVEIVRVDAEGNLVESGGMATGDCETCKFCATPVASETPGAGAATHPDLPSASDGWPVVASVAAGREGLWPETRGPPSDSMNTGFLPLTPASIAADFARRAPWT